MVPTNVIPFPGVKYSSHCGACPECGKTDGYYNVGKEHWFICRDHKTKWLGGYNLFDNWMDQTVAQTETINELLYGYKEVLPHRQQAPVSQTASGS
ncbi:MAG: hypothetical protein RLT87_13205 [Gammaproteobacteria bacterium]